MQSQKGCLQCGGMISWMKLFVGVGLVPWRCDACTSNRWGICRISSQARCGMRFLRSPAFELLQLCWKVSWDPFWGGWIGAHWRGQRLLRQWFRYWLQQRYHQLGAGVTPGYCLWDQSRGTVHVLWGWGQFFLGYNTHVFLIGKGLQGVIALQKGLGWHVLVG